MPIKKSDDIDDAISIEITNREAQLVLKYGYPFPEQATLFEGCSKKSGYHRLTIDKYWLELIIGDLSRSLKNVRSASLIDELDELCSALETAISRGSMSSIE